MNQFDHIAVLGLVSGVEDEPTQRYVASKPNHFELDQKVLITHNMSWQVAHYDQEPLPSLVTPSTASRVGYLNQTREAS